MCRLLPGTSGGLIYRRSWCWPSDTRDGPEVPWRSWPSDLGAGVGAAAWTWGQQGRKNVPGTPALPQGTPCSQALQPPPAPVSSNHALSSHQYAGSPFIPVLLQCRFGQLPCHFCLFADAAGAAPRTGPCWQVASSPWAAGTAPSLQHMGTLRSLEK